MRANAGIYLRTMMLVCVAWTVLLGLIAPAAAQPVAAVTEYYHADALGSTRTVTDQSGAVVRRYDYAPFGEQDSPCTASADRRLFTGQPRDRETCLDYFGARHYRSTLGRFLTIDPALDISAALVDPQRWNRYSYARNNPTKFVDPDGREIAVLLGGRLINVGLDTTPVGQPNAAALLMVAGRAAAGVVGPLALPVARGVYQLIFGCAVSPRCVETVHETIEEAANVSSSSGRITPSAVQLASMERTLSKGGRKAVEKSIRTLEGLIEEHNKKILDAKATGGYTSSMEKELRNFKRLIEAARSVLDNE